MNSFLKAERLQNIKSSLKRGEQKRLAIESNVNEGQLSVYLTRPHLFDLNPSIVQKIINGYAKMQNELTKIQSSS